MFGCLFRYSLAEGNLPLFRTTSFVQELNEVVNFMRKSDQLNNIVDKLVKNPHDRRIIMCLWNVGQKLNPKDCFTQYYVSNGCLSCLFHLTSCNGNDLSGYVFKYAIITHVLANITNLHPGELIHSVGHYNITDQKIECNGKVKINAKLNSIDNISDGCFSLDTDKASNDHLLNIISKSSSSIFNGKSNSHTVNAEELQYLSTCEDIINHGIEKMDRTKVGTLSMFGVINRYNLKNSTFPLLTTKRVFYKGVLEELLWFIKGSTNAKDLSKRGVKIWDENGSRKFLDSLGFTEREEGDLGPVYGFQWRHFGASYTNCEADYTGKGFDQLKNIVNKLQNKHSQTNEPLIMCAWNVFDLDLMALPPCHCFVQFSVNSNNGLSCLMYQRSGDMGLGVPFNIASYSLLTLILANVCNLQPEEFIHIIGDAHVYSNHVEPLKKQIQREPRQFPKLKINRKLTSIDDIHPNDFELIDYHPHPKIEMEMAV